MTMRRNLFAAALCVFLLACGKPSAKDISFTRQDGSEITFHAELAVTDAQRQQGLMGRQDLEPLHGMLFVFPAEQKVAFWMKNTPLFLDMIFIDATGKIVYIHHKARPFDQTLIATPVPARYVLEIKGGEAEAQRLQTGDQLKL
jgi:uncharacterized membrane protein (UPF0127 family)